MTRKPLARGRDAVLRQALTHGRVTVLTAARSSIDRLVRLGLLAETDLLGTYSLTTNGLCAVGEHPF